MTEIKIINRKPNKRQKYIKERNRILVGAYDYEISVPFAYGQSQKSMLRLYKSAWQANKSGSIGIYMVVQNKKSILIREIYKIYLVFFNF